MRISPGFLSLLASASFPLIFVAAQPAAAGLVTDSVTFSPNLLIPDNSLVGVADTRTFSSALTEISSVRVMLRIEGTPAPGNAYNGDFYAYLTHSSGFAVLLNRVGRTASNSFGYADSGFDVTFTDAAGAGDIHNYNQTVNPAGGMLTGDWAPDGRNINPNSVLDSTPRTALLTSFNNLDPNGDWTLFVADVSAGGTGRLASWGLEITGSAPIPEPATGAFGMMLVATLAGRRVSRTATIR